TGDWTASCEQYEGLLAKDSADVEAWYGLGECMYHNLDVAPIAGDTTRMRFLGDWNRSIDAFQKVLELDPSYHLAYAHIVDILTSERHTQGCYRPNTSTRCVQLWGSYLLRDGDSLLVAPLHFQRDTAAIRMQVDRYTLTQSRRRNLQEADAMATAWVRASPSEQRALRELAHVRLLQGRARSADSIYAALTERSSTWLEELRSGLDGMEISYKLGRGLEAAARYDSIRASTTMIPNPQGPIPFGSAVAGYGPAFGRLAEFDSVLATNMRASNAPQFVIDYQLLQYRALVGVPGDSVTAMERVVFDTVRALRGASIATRNISGMLAYGLRVPRSAWPALDTSLKEPRLQPAIAMSLKDTARLRRSLRALDSIISAHAAAGGADSGYAVPAADGYLILGDSAAALRTLRVALDSLLPTTGLFLTNQGGLSPVMFVPRMMLLRADLAAARGSLDEARHWYKRFIDVWAQGSPELQPAVERARKAYTALGGS
ncbi:MAG TPA: tetratricopeptide repeat protein, partial [Gemmatimonadaceae bacterium]|nr:tetratricopeptide repeat protein [Gemmatimonadaceae bacterium]